METAKVLVSGNDFPGSALKILTDNNFTVVQSRYSNFGEEGRQKNAPELLQLITGCAALIWISDLPITSELLDKAGPSLKLVSTVSAGYNHCAVDELRKRGIKLSNTPEVLSSAVAEVAVALMMGAARRFTENLALVQSGKWTTGFQNMLGQDIRGSVVGIIGLGGIGQAVVRRLAGFEVNNFLYTGHREKPEAKTLGATFVTLEELLKQSDFIILSVPLTDETRHMINAQTIAKMKRNAIIVNIGRGVILPHIGSATVSTRCDMADLAANNVVNGLHGKPLLTPVLQ